MRLHRLKLSVVLGLIFASLSILVSQRLAAAAPAYQLTPFPTPTPGSDGRILYQVQPGDTLWHIAVVSGITIDELRQLNNLVGDDIQEGQILLLGFGGPAATAESPGALPTLNPEAAIPTPTSGPGSGRLCVLIYADINGDAIRQEEEVAIGGGAVSVADPEGVITLQQETLAGPATADEEIPRACFESLPEGEYTVSVAIPDGYNATTKLNYTLLVRPGDESFLDFGGQLNSEAIGEELYNPTGAGQRSPLTLWLGGALLLAGLGLALFANRFARR